MACGKAVRSEVELAGVRVPLKARHDISAAHVLDLQHAESSCTTLTCHDQTKCTLGLGQACSFAAGGDMQPLEAEQDKHVERCCEGSTALWARIMQSLQIEVAWVAFSLGAPHKTPQLSVLGGDP